MLNNKFVNAHNVSYTPDRWLTYDDVLLMPQFSDLNSRNDPSINLTTRLTSGVTINSPIISANMDTITGANMAIAMHRIGGHGIMHRFYPSQEDRWADIVAMGDATKLPSFSIGADSEEIGFVFEVLQKYGQAVVCVDVAHGHLKKCIDQVYNLRKEFAGKVQIIAGNVVTPRGAMDLVQAGAHGIKVGVGNSGICSTRLVSGHGIPQLSAILQIRAALFGSKSNTTLIADGGIKNSGDVCVTGDTLILTSDLRWVRADELKIGDNLIGFDEYPVEHNDTMLKRRRYQKTKVLANNVNHLECLRFTTDKEKTLTVSLQHKMLCKSKKSNALVWKEAQELKIDDEIVYFGDTWEESDSKSSGYVAGFLDGEGALCKSGRCRSLSVSQVLGETSDLFAEQMSEFTSIKRYLRKHDGDPNHQQQESICVYGIYNIIRLLGIVRPHRLLNKSESIWSSDVMNTGRAKITKIENVGIQKTYTVTTSTQTFIANGYMSHNCKALAAGANSVMIGNLFSGTDETPGNIEADGDERYKIYRGQSSQSFLNDRGKTGVTAEGITIKVPVKGSVYNIYQELVGGIRSGMTYTGVNNVNDLFNKGIFVEITNNGRTESTTYYAAN